MLFGMLELKLEEWNVMWPIWKPFPLTLTRTARTNILWSAFFPEVTPLTSLQDWTSSSTIRLVTLGQTSKGPSHLSLSPTIVRRCCPEKKCIVRMDSTCNNISHGRLWYEAQGIPEQVRIFLFKNHQENFLHGFESQVFVNHWSFRLSMHLILVQHGTTE